MLEKPIRDRRLSRGHVLLVVGALGLALAGVTAVSVRGTPCTPARGVDPYASEDWLAFERVPRDEQGIIFLRDERRYFHPVATAQAALTDLALGDTDSALRLGEQLIANSTLIGGARYFPYEFPYAWNEQALAPPWYSGMAQGQALDVFARLGAATGDSRWEVAAEETYASLADGAPLPLVRREGGHAWIEEYPVEDPATVFNGHVFATFGVYSHWSRTGKGYDLLCSALAASKDHLKIWVDDSGRTWYDLERTRGESPLYRRIHAWQLEALGQITGDEAFVEAADDVAVP